MTTHYEIEPIAAERFGATIWVITRELPSTGGQFFKLSGFKNKKKTTYAVPNFNNYLIATPAIAKVPRKVLHWVRDVMEAC